MKKVWKKIINLLFLNLILCSSCSILHPKVPLDYPNSIWVSQTNDPIDVILNVDENGEVTSEIIYNDNTLEFTIDIVSEVMFFYLLNDEQKGFSVSHSFVINDEILKCKLRDDFGNIFSLDEPVNLSFTLTKVSG